MDGGRGRCATEKRRGQTTQLSRHQRASATRRPEQIVRDESFLGGEQKNVLPPTFLLFFFVMDFFPPLV